jgi:hypothetical protein
MEQNEFSVVQLIDDLNFDVVDAEHAVGQIDQVPVSLAVLSVHPPGLLFGFRINPETTNTAPILQMFDESSKEFASTSIDGGIAWLSLYNLLGATSAAVESLLTQMIQVIDSSGLRLPAVCQSCGTAENANVVLVQSRPTRVCANCLAQKIEQNQQLQAKLDRGNLATTLSLPGVCGFVAVGWAAFWIAIDLLMAFFQVNAIWLNEFTTLLILGLAAIVGYLLGRPMGLTLRRSRFVKRAPILMSVALVAVACIAGEIGFVALLLLRRLGVFDLNIAIKVLRFLLADYSPFWIGCKLLVMAAIGTFCIVAALERKTVDLRI